MVYSAETNERRSFDLAQVSMGEYRLRISFVIQPYRLPTPFRATGAS